MNGSESVNGATSGDATAPEPGDARVSGNARVSGALRLGDDRLILSQRLCERVGHAPAIEEDIAMANAALDLLGQARLWLSLAGETEGRGRDEDALAFFRDESEFQNTPLAEQPNGDFAATIARQYFFDLRANLALPQIAAGSDSRFAEIAAKGAVEARYHLRRSEMWMLRLGDGDAESARRMRDAVADLWRFCGAMFFADDADRELAKAGIAPNPESLRDPWLDAVRQTFARAKLEVPDETELDDGRALRRTEHLGFILAEMQRLPRAHPGAKW